jgi:hypothetical protein
MQRHLHHRKADADPVRAHGDGGSEHHRIRVRHGPVAMMFGQPHCIHPDGLSQFDLTQSLLNDLVVLRGITAERKHEGAEAHGVLLIAGGARGPVTRRRTPPRMPPLLAGEYGPGGRRTQAETPALVRVYPQGPGQWRALELAVSGPWDQRVRVGELTVVCCHA